MYLYRIPLRKRTIRKKRKKAKRVAKQPIKIRRKKK
jgi:hypothetical protein